MMPHAMIVSEMSRRLVQTEEETAGSVGVRAWLVFENMILLAYLLQLSEREHRLLCFRKYRLLHS